jgi:hypothetical protein
LSKRVFPRRVRQLLEGIFEIVTSEMDRSLANSLDGLEQELFKQAEQARGNELQLHCLEALGNIKRGRSDLTPRFIALLESSLASIKDPPPTITTAPGHRGFTELTLVDDSDLDETAQLHHISARAEMRNSLPLFLLSQRFGVLAGRPAMDSESLPISPTVLCKHFRRASECFELHPELRQMLFRQFDRHVMMDYGRLVDSVNAYLVNQGVLPNLNYVPTRLNPGPRRDGKEAPTVRPLDSPAPTGPARGPTFTGWPGDAIGAAARSGGAAGRPVSSNDIYTNLRDLLHSARKPASDKPAPVHKQAPDSQPGNVASTSDVQSVLGLLQRRAPTPTLVNGRPVVRSVQHVKQDLLAHLRQISRNDPPPALAENDTDTIELVGMLFDQLMKDVRPNSPAANLLQKLLVPLMRVALRDKDFFTQGEHPARQMLDTVAETGVYWVGDAGPDKELMGKVDTLVDRLCAEFDGDIGVFHNLLGDLSQHTQSVMRKAEVAERRHVEASLGREKLAIAQAHASEIMGEITRVHTVPRFTRALLTQAWTDVLALTSLRHGENSEEWKQQVEVAKRIAIVAEGAQPDPDAAGELGRHVEESLKQVGYHADEAAAIGQRLTASDSTEEDPASRTELTMKLKARARLGESLGHHPEANMLPPMNAKEQECLERIRALPFGTWLEFVTNQQGDRIRRRLSWFSPLSGHCLLINHRGQRVGEYTLDTLARAMARDQVFVIDKPRDSFIDRAIVAVRERLQSNDPASPEGGRA